MILVQIKSFLLIWLVCVGTMYYIRGRSNGNIFLPGDIHIQKEGRTIYFPLGSSIILAILFFSILRGLSSKF